MVHNYKHTKTAKIALDTQGLASVMLSVAFSQLIPNSHQSKDNTHQTALLTVMLLDIIGLRYKGLLIFSQTT